MTEELGMGITIGLKDNFTANAQRIQTSMGGLTGGFDRLAARAFQFQNITNAIQGIDQALGLIRGPGQAFDTQLTDLSAITGVTGAALTGLGERARGLALDFGGRAPAQVESFKQILSRLGPQIAQNADALQLMGRNVSLLSKTMNDDAVGATDALTTSMLQYNVDVTDAAGAAAVMTTQMDMMTNAALVGSAEVPQIAATLKVAGGAAYNAGVQFEELQAAIQVMGKAALYGSEAGTGLRNVLAKLSEGRFIPRHTQEALAAAGVNINVLADRSLSLQQRLEELKKIQGDSALVAKFFGIENARAATVLLNNTELLGTWTAQIAESSGATQRYADTVMGSFEQRMKRMTAQLEDWAISVFESIKGAMPFIQATITMGFHLAQMGPLLSMVRNGLLKLRLAEILTALSTNGLNAALAIMKTRLIAAGNAALTAIRPFLPLIAKIAAFVALAYAMDKALQQNGEAWKWLGVVIGAVLIAVMGPLGAFIAIFIFLKNAVTAFKDVMENNAPARGGLAGFLQKLGGIMYAIVEIFSTATMEGWSMSRKLVDALKRIGIYEFVVSLGTWLIRLKALFGGIWDGISTIFKAVAGFIEFISGLFDPVIEQMQEWGWISRNAASTTNDWAEAGKILGYIIGTVLVVAVVALTIKMAILAITTIAAFFIPIVIILAIIAIITLVILAIVYWEEIWQWLGETFEAVTGWIAECILAIYQHFVDVGMAITEFFTGILQWFAELPGRFYDWGREMLQNLWDGLKSLWNDFVGWLDETFMKPFELAFAITTGDTDALLTPEMAEAGGYQNLLAQHSQAQAAQATASTVNVNVPRQERQAAPTIMTSIQLDGEAIAANVMNRVSTENQRRQ